MFLERLDVEKLYNKYRPARFDQIVGQDKVINTLKNAIVNKSYAFWRNLIFYSNVGGVGKTAAARIFAKAVNCKDPVGGEPCGACPNCIAFDKRQFSDIMELNGAEYNSVDHIKKLVDQATRFPNQPGCCRVIIIDEFHRISTAGQDSLLKLFEEAKIPNIFICCTTEFKSVRDTIRTRCYNFCFNIIRQRDIVKHVKGICERESIKYSEKDLTNLARISKGSLREAVKRLEVEKVNWGDLFHLDIYDLNKYSLLLKFFVDVVYYSNWEGMEDLSGREISFKSDFSNVLFDLLNFDMGLEPKYLSVEEIKKAYVLFDVGYFNRVADKLLSSKIETLEVFILFLRSLGKGGFEVKKNNIVSNEGNGRRWVSSPKHGLIETKPLPPVRVAEKIETEYVDISDLVEKPAEKKAEITIEERLLKLGIKVTKNV